MEVLCPKCGEPYENDDFHERAQEIDSTYHEVTADFRRRGCVAMGSTCDPDGLGSTRAEVANAIYDLLGDDMDGAASEFDDAEFLGFI